MMVGKSEITGILFCYIDVLNEGQPKSTVL